MTATFNDFVKYCEADLGRPATTMRRLGKIVRTTPSKRGRGASNIDARDSVAGLLAALLPVTESNAAATIDYTSRLPLFFISSESRSEALGRARSIGIDVLTNFGQALAVIIDRLRTPEHRLTESVFVDFYNSGRSAIISFLPDDRDGGFSLHFARADEQPPLVTTYSRIDLRVLRSLADMLGPLPNAPPPPPY